MTQDHAWELMQQVGNKLDNLQNTVTAFIARQETICANQREHSQRMFRDLYGNGKPGMVETVKRLDDADAFRRKVVVASVGLILTNVGTIITFVWAFIRS